MTPEETPTKQPVFQQLPGITLRQLEVFHVVCREGSYANAALELRSTRTNIKRVCQDFEVAVGHPLFGENPDKTLEPTAFALGLLGQIGPLSRGLRRLGENVRSLHEKGRILRFAAAGEFFKGGPFTDFLARVKISDTFRPCFLRIETNRHRTALLNVECDVYFGVGLSASDRLDCVALGPIPWKFQPGPRYRGGHLATPADLKPGKWWIADVGDPDVSSRMLDEFHAAGAKNGRILGGNDEAADDEIVLSPDATARHVPTVRDSWPCHRFSAVLRKNHPYSELLPRLTGAAVP